MNAVAQKLFNLSYLEQMNDNNFILQVVDLYIKDTAVDLLSLEKALAAAEYPDVKMIAHKLKSSTGMLQANMLYHILEQIEKIAATEGDIPQLAALVQAAANEFCQLQFELECYLQEL